MTGARIIGLISDTHNLLRPQAMKALRNSDVILHAGDIGNREILESLETIAPVYAVRGNNDRAGWAQSIPETRMLELFGRRIYLIHNVREMHVDPSAEKIDIVVFGHSHKPVIETHNGVLYINPGSAGPRRFRLPVAVARIEITAKKVKPQIIEIHV